MKERETKTASKKLQNNGKGKRRIKNLSDEQTETEKEEFYKFSLRENKEKNHNQSVL